MADELKEVLELQKKNCIFCKIISKEIPSKDIYEDDKVMVILDINPANEGHMLILPKEHYQILPQMPPELVKYMGVIAKRASRTLLRALGVQGTSIFLANGVAAGQKAPHFMIHVIPRKQGDMLFNISKSKVDEKQLTTIFNLMQSVVSPHKKPEKVIYPEDKKDSLQDSHKDSKEIGSNQSNVDLDKISRLFK